MQRMTDEEIEAYRTEFPDEIIGLMATARVKAEVLDQSQHDPDPGAPEAALKRYYSHLRHLRQRAEFYHKKRMNDFGFDHLKLRRLIISVDEILSE